MAIDKGIAMEVEVQSNTELGHLNLTLGELGRAWEANKKVLRPSGSYPVLG
jgi:hypothetical protein